jgi:hypothetical protein
MTQTLEQPVIRVRFFWPTHRDWYAMARNQAVTLPVTLP